MIIKRQQKLNIKIIGHEIGMNIQNFMHYLLVIEIIGEMINITEIYDDEAEIVH